MKNTGLTKVFTFGALVLSVMMLVSFLIPAPAAEASSSASPCPHYSIQDVFDDPSGNWDGDQVRNSDELYNGMNPCIVDTAEYCSGGGNPLCYYPTYSYVSYSTACQSSINAYPNGDYDGDGITNAVEVRNGANPCAHPCPYPTGADIALNPNGSWDNDGISNAVEVNQGTNPCDGYRYNPCPHYSQYQVNAMPGLDWDGDGVTNSTEIYNGTNPCIFNAVKYVQYVPYTPTVTQRLPHVTTVNRYVYVPVVRPTCPSNYPYYHAGNGLCYANPITPFV